MNDSSTGWKRVLGTLGGAFLGLVLLVAAWAKVLDPAAFASEIERQGLAFLLPALVVAWIALAIEVGLGSLLMTGVRRWWVLWPSALLVVFFLFLTGRDYLRYLRGEEMEEASCGCFGNLVERTPAEAFWQDLLLMVPALLLAFLGAKAVAGFPRLRVVLATILTVATVLFAWKAPVLPLDNLATRLKPGMEPMAHCVGSAEKGNEACLSVVLPELAEGEHLVVMADLEDPAFLEQVSALNEHIWSGTGLPLWVVTASPEEALFEFRFTHGPAFEAREAPKALLAPLYRSLPRSFRTQDGVVVETYAGLPPLAP